MKRMIDFLKVTGAGNDFVLIDNFDLAFSMDWASVARSVCSRPFGVGADGLLVIEPSRQASFTMRYYNADGSSGGMCGNGGRCVARYQVEKRGGGPDITFDACGELYHASVTGHSVRLGMTDVRRVHSPDTFIVDGGETLEGWIVDTGSPHVVVPTESVDTIDVERIGRILRHHPLVKHVGGANVDFLAVEGKHHIRIRTYERGVESETLACGTGAVASAAVAFFQSFAAPPISVTVRSGQTLTVDFRPSDLSLTDVVLEGSARFLFNGRFELEEGGSIKPAEEEIRRPETDR